MDRDAIMTPSSPHDGHGTPDTTKIASTHLPGPAAPATATPHISTRRQTDRTDSAAQKTLPAWSHALLRPGTPLVRLRDAGVTYDSGKTWAIRHVDLEVLPGDDIALIGPNGSGKTTLSRVIAGLLAPDEGTVELMGRVVADSGGAHEQAYRLARRHIGAVFQNPQDQILTTGVRQDVAFGPENLAVPSEQLPGRVDSALADVGLDDLGDTDPDTLSGGQQQREAIADMLAMHPGLLVLDEPAAMLDPASRACVLSVLDRLHRCGTTLLTVTHSPAVAARARRVLRLSWSDGRSVLASAPAAGVSRLRAVEYPATRTSIPANAADLMGGGYQKPTARNADTTNPEQTSGPEQTQTLRINDPGVRTAAQAGQAAAQAGQTTSNAPVVLAARGLSYRYADTDGGHGSRSHWVLKNVDLALRKGEILALRGANGSGKSTLLRLLALLDRPTAGALDLFGTRIEAGRRLPARRRRELRAHIGYAMQHPQRQLFAQTVRADVAFGPDNLLPDLPEHERRMLVDRTMADLGIADLADRSPFDLSGGQQRLAAFAGVIASRPGLLLLDEPSAGLDAEASARLHALLRRLAENGTAILLVTHSDAEVRALGATVVEMAEINHADMTARNPPSSPTAPSASAAPGHPGDADRTVTYSLPHDSFLSRADPRVTLLAMVVAMIDVFAVSSPVQLLLALAGAGLFLAAACVRPRRLLRVLHPLLLVLVLVAVVNMLVVRTGRPLVRLGDPPHPAFLLTTGGVWAGILYSARLLVLLLLGAAVVEAVSPTRLADGFTGLLAPLAKAGAHVQEIGLVLVLALRFLPLISDETRDIALAQTARGGSVSSGSPVRRLRAMLALLIPVTAASARHAETTALALDARCYEEGITRTHLVPLKTGWRDTVLTATVVGFLAMIAVLGILGI